jgi:RNA polymerase sigma-70 factor (ECF subfamily)
MKKDQFWTWLEPLHEPAVRFCRKLTGNRDEGDDLYQESLVTALEKIDTLRKEAAFKPWLYRIMVNSYKNRLRCPWRRWRATIAADMPETTKTADPAAQLTARRWLERAFRALKPEEKALIVLFEIEGWKVSELAEIYDSPEGTIKARLARARRKMRHALVEYGGEEKLKEFAKGGRVCVAAKPDIE